MLDDPCPQILASALPAVEASSIKALCYTSSGLAVATASTVNGSSAVSSSNSSIPGRRRLMSCSGNSSVVAMLTLEVRSNQAMIPS